MKIISKFKDYYDGGVTYGIDQTHVYVRKTEDLDQYQLKTGRYNHSVPFQIIGFCGEIHMFVTPEDEIYRLGSYEYEFDPKKHILWNEDILKYTFKKYTDKRDRVVIKKVERDDEDRQFYYFLGNLGRIYEETKSRSDLKELFIKHSVPVFAIVNVLRSTHLILNPNLTDYGFYKIYEVMQAYQRIEQFISNQLAQECQGKVPVGDDEVIGISKGFDRCSFRNTKEGSKPKKW